MALGSLRQRQHRQEAQHDQQRIRHQQFGERIFPGQRTPDTEQSGIHPGHRRQRATKQCQHPRTEPEVEQGACLLQRRQYQAVQHNTVVRQQQDNNHLGVKLGIHEVLHAFAQVIDANDGGACHP
ncbi:hypothetical protein D3C80_1878550 [compost metagenome]